MSTMTSLIKILLKDLQELHDSGAIDTICVTAIGPRRDRDFHFVASDSIRLDNGLRILEALSATREHVNREMVLSRNPNFDSAE